MLRPTRVSIFPTCLTDFGTPATTSFEIRQDGEVSDATTSDDETAARGSQGKIRALAAKQKHRSKMMGATDAGVLTFLELSAVKDERKYKKEYCDFLDDATAHGERLVADIEVDDSAVRRCNDLYRTGFSANKGETMFAAICRFVPDFGKFGRRRLPRLQRALKGWRRRVPSRSRLCRCWAMWAAVI